MNSVILKSMARLFFFAMAIFAAFVLLRGHNEPGGGFIGGLIMAAAYAVIALAFGVGEARRYLVLHPVTVMGLGLVFAILSGLPPVIGGDAAFLTHLWATLFGIKLGTTIIFDVGVFLVVVGGVMAMILPLYEETKNA